MQQRSQRITLYAHLTIPKIASVVVYIFTAYLLPLVLSSTRPHLKSQQWQLSVSREFFHLGLNIKTTIIACLRMVSLRTLCVGNFGVKFACQFLQDRKIQPT
ncbi:hypothetical protein Anacy_2494 [Anabaena cylindrica PCC 7122]|uniref:Uncharacterized protein n=1 Tax=Anabaena cylindrica (strain ATCC 27899 / PCC 7122) TaxID=272123 RepID=K9ZH99_ANACC|nr:hypothetical protein Anacy_2494 [Anabaena cylindrica PCC 7122]BAY05096.1 hypothetical protein NIES19_43650 [Anabaena cylindrica PCC 7122]